MNPLEHALFVVGLAIEAGEITRKDLLDTLAEITGMAHHYDPPDMSTWHRPPPGDEGELGSALNARLMRKYRHLISPRG